MKQFMLLFRGNPQNATSKPSPEQQQQNMQHWGQWMGKLNQNGAFVSGLPFTPGGRIIRGKAMTVTEGVYGEQEPVGGFLLINANDFDAAVEIAKGCPAFDIETNPIVEVREIKEIKM